ncbi:MAG: hypothetical protein QXO32_00575 [Candidatus Bathyarchaeia archaeon]
MEVLDASELKEKYGNVEWISPYQRIVAMTGDDGLIEIHEFHARGKCIGGSAWEIYHYPRVSKLVLSARREGARNIFVLKAGRCDLNLIPGLAGAGIERAEVKGDEAHITYAGLAGGGIAATVCRGLAEGVKRIEIHERGGGGKLGRSTLILPLRRKIILGVDDTDEPRRGATWSLINEISNTLDREGVAEYLGHTITQLYTKNPVKTTNCVSIAATFAVEPNSVNRLQDLFISRVKAATFSPHTGLAIYGNIQANDGLKAYTMEAKSRLVELSEAEEVAEREGVKLIPITGERGLIGALAAIGYADNPDEAVKPFR